MVRRGILLLLLAACLSLAVAKKLDIRGGQELGAAADAIIASAGSGGSCVRDATGTCVATAPKPTAPQPVAGAGQIKPPAALPAFALIWSDEFSGPALDATKWTPQTGDGSAFGIPGWGNDELEYYTADSKNVRIDPVNGHLVIEARAEPMGGYPYTSGRIRTFGKFAVGPISYYTVKVEASINVPQGTGLWPAFWMLPTTGCPATCSGCGKWGGWPTSGEIDIMENRNDAFWSQGSIHFGGAPPKNKMITGGSCMPTNCATTLAGTFHKYAVEWERKQIRWYLDDQLVFTAFSANGTRTNGWYTDTKRAPTDAPFGDGLQEFHILINLAVGGSYAQSTWLPVNQQIPDSAIPATFTNGPKQMLVDYVRVYAR